MKGKNKLIAVLLTMVAFVTTGIAFALGGAVETIRYARADEAVGFTAELEGGVIFSAEKVYFAVDENGVSDRTNPLAYKGYNFNSIKGSGNTTEYFADYGLTNNPGDYSNKSIIKNEEFVMVDDRAIYTADDNATHLKQGIMITLGGYYYGEAGNFNTNTMELKENADGAKEWNVSSNEVGANMSYVSAQAFLNGEAVQLPSARGYSNGEYQDFTWFITPTASSEGHYEISFSYMKNGVSLRYDFEFYLLLQSSYDKKVEVEGKEYTSKPTIDRAIPKDGGFVFYSGTSLDYPTLTFDYSRYDLTITHNSGDVTTNIDFDYDESNNAITLSKQVYNEVEVKTYPIEQFTTINSIITLMFTEHGKYDFEFQHIYKYKGEKIAIPNEQIPISNITLNIYGYQLKYAKSGFNGADMTYLEIYQNNTMFVLLNGFINANNETLGDNLGVNYKLIKNDFARKTGEISSTKSKSANSVDFEKLDEDGLKNIEYQKTDRGLWLTLNDLYVLKTTNIVGGETVTTLESYYYYSATGKIKTTDRIDSKKTLLTKVTTFTAPGYYLVQAKYKYNDTDKATQYFAFEITSATPTLQLWKTEKNNFDEVDDSNKVDFYAHEYTNQNVYAWWKETDVFESSIAGKLYYADGKYETEANLKKVADGLNDSSITKVSYDKNTLIKNSGSYLLVLEVERSATKTYTYFTIDKEGISGLKIYEVATGSIDNRAIYSIKQDASLNYITHTSKSVIDTTFTLDWANKASGANITATYKLTPFIKSNANNSLNNKITITSGNTTYKYILNEYGVGQTSNPISIQKPLALSAALDVNNVLSDQGIYEFELVDQAGNKLNYIIIVDQTEGVINATYGDNKSAYLSGQMVADYVELEWGTHKAIDLGSPEHDSTVYKLLENNADSFKHYYKETGNNLFELVNMFKKQVGEKNLFVVENAYTEIRLRPFDQYKDNYYVITNNGTKQIKYPNGVTTTGWDATANDLFTTDGIDKDIRINIDSDELRRYTFDVVNDSRVNNTSNTSFTVYITPDKAQGEVYSSTQEGVEYNTSVLAHGEATEYYGTDKTDENIKIDSYFKGQASNDGVFIFEWLEPSDEDNFKVTDVRYNYYQLMDQDVLNSTEVIGDKNREKYPYYPYQYINSNYILKTEENGIQSVSKYEKTNREIMGGNGKITKNINRSEAINLAYETYYDANGDLVSKKVTQTGLYIITRTITINADEGQDAQTSEMSYAFFVDRNMIVGYNITDINEKIVGQFIHAAMPNSWDAEDVKYDNFTKQGLKTQKATYKDETINYEVYLETNKLPTRVKVPSGKYVSGNSDTRNIALTSHINLSLKLSVYYLDSYKLLPDTYKGTFFKIMDNVTGDEDGYIDFNGTYLNTAEVTVFKNARIHTRGDGNLSLPGTYVFVINDTVSKKVNEKFEVIDCNEFVFGVKLTKQEPTTDVYAYTEIDGKSSDKVYADNNILYTNQEFVDFIIPVEDRYSYNAQLDIASIEIYRNDLVNPWLKLVSTGDGQFKPDANGFVQSLTLDRFEEVYENSTLVGYKIKLDSGLSVVDGKIVDYKEYVYIINIKYILTNSHTDYYTYKYAVDNDGDDTTKDILLNDSFYQSQYTVVIDRSPNTTNLDSLMTEQGEYFTDYHTWLAEQNSTEFNGDVNDNFAYRSTTDRKDYYALTNALYYEYLTQAGTLSNQAMYALNVGLDSTFNPAGLTTIYYRRLNFNASSNIAKTRMGLLPITDHYFQTDTYYIFNENRTEYQAYSTQNSDYLDKNSNIYYLSILNIEKDANGSYETAYNNNCGGFYEIVEKDLAGNYTQYVIYFAPTETQDVVISVDGKNVEHDNDTTPINFNNSDTSKQNTFIGINFVKSIDGLAEHLGDNRYNSYYSNINIYNASREKIKTIYVNSISQHAEYSAEYKDDEYVGGEYTALGIESEIYDVIKNEGNYIIEFINVFGESYSKVVNNYTSDDHKLNTATLVVKTDYVGRKYITFSDLNTKINNTYWYVTEVKITYQSTKTIVYTANIPTNGKTVLEYSSEKSNVEEIEVQKDAVETDRLNLEKGIQYLVTLKDVGGNTYAIPISTSDGYYAYNLELPANAYAHNDVYYTANEIKLSYNTDLYEAKVSVTSDGLVIPQDEHKNYYTENKESTSYSKITLKPDDKTNPSNHFGSLRVFEVKLILKEANEESKTYKIYIDTRATAFGIENINKEDKISNVKSHLKNGVDGNYQDYNIMDLIGKEFYSELISETITISWSRLTSDYFTYNYELFEFVNKDEYRSLLTDSGSNSYTIAPKENTTGKYIFKVTIKSKDNTWIATRVYGIFMSTTITGLYEVKNGDGEVYDYSAITNLSEIMESIGTNRTAMATALGYGTAEDMEAVFTSFGYKTAIPMYIANTDLYLNSNKDNGVDSKSYQPSTGGYATITFYRVFRANYQTFAVIMEVLPTDTNQNLMSVFSFVTKDGEDGENLLTAGNAKTIYRQDADFYQLKFSSYNKNMATTPLEKHNKIIIDVYYNNVFAKRVKGGDTGVSTIDFKNSGNYKLEVMDEAGNKQYFKTSTYTTTSFTLVVMTEMLYTINNEAPIQYAYYDSPVTLQINRYNDATGKNNYDINTITLKAVLNSQNYTGYEHPTDSSTYIFKDYGTYLITMTANLLTSNKDETIKVTSQLVFTILNPNEARKALDFTSIYGYNIISVFSVTKTAEKDVTDKFMDLLQDKSNVGEVNMYNKLVTYERLVDAFNTSTQGKMKFRVLYEVKNDDLLPARRAEFSFTLNNETATINSSIEAGGKTTKDVTLRFNAANIYDQIGDCYLVINGEKVLKIDSTSQNTITEIKVTQVGHYYVQLMGDSGSVATSFNFTIKEPLNTVSIILIVVVSAIVIALVGTFIWLRTRMKVR